MNFELFVSLRYLHGRKMGFVSIITMLSIIGVILGTVVLICALSISNGFETEVRDRIVGTFAHARILKYNGESVTNPDSLSREIEKHPQVVATAPIIMGKGAAECESLQEGVMIMAIDDSLEKGVSDLHKKIVDGEFSLAPTKSKRDRELPACFIGNGLAAKFGVRAKDEIVLMTVSQEDGSIDPTPKMIRLVISGVFETGMYEYDQGLIYVSIGSGQKLFSMPNGVEGISLRVKEMNNAASIAKEINEQLGGYPFKFSDWQTQNKSLFQWMKLEKLIITLFLSIIILVAAFNIMATRIMIIMEKRREIGILMSMGVTRAGIMKIFLLNGVVIGLIGSTIGTTIGVLISYIQHKYHLIPLAGDIYFVNFLPAIVEPMDVLTVFIGTNVLCILATLYPAWSASKLLPAQAIRLE